MLEHVLTGARTVAVVGGGPCGAAAAHAFLKDPDQRFTKVQVFERRAEFGGLWNYEPVQDSSYPVPLVDPAVVTKPVAPHRYPLAVYDLLDTNVPRGMMEFQGTGFSADLPLFPLHPQVREFIQRYLEDLRGVTRFNTLVERVQQRADWKWEVEFTVDGGERQVEVYDLVVAATGNYEVPFIPPVQGVGEEGPMAVEHVKLYVHPLQYREAYGRGKVVVVGGGVLGNEIAVHIAEEMQGPVYQSVRSDAEEQAPVGVVRIREIARFDRPHRTLHLVDGLVVEEVSLVLFATGYLKAFPYLWPMYGGVCETPVVTDGARVRGLWQHMLAVHHPGLVFVGLPRLLLPTRVAESQLLWVARVCWGHLPFPRELREDPLAWEQQVVAAKGDGANFHDLGNLEDVAYCEWLNLQVERAESGHPGGYVPRPWSTEDKLARKQLKAIKQGYLRMAKATGRRAMSIQELVDGGWFAWA